MTLKRDIFSGLLNIFAIHPFCRNYLQPEQPGQPAHLLRMDASATKADLLTIFQQSENFQAGTQDFDKLFVNAVEPDSEDRFQYYFLTEKP